jgi:hypothetical protein
MLMLLYIAVIHIAVTTGYLAWWASPGGTIFRKGARQEYKKLELRHLMTVAETHKASLIWNLQADMGVPPLTLHIHGKQTHFLLWSGTSGIDKVIEDGILKVRHFLS